MTYAQSIHAPQVIVESSHGAVLAQRSGRAKWHQLGYAAGYRQGARFRSMPLASGQGPRASTGLAVRKQPFGEHLIHLEVLDLGTNWLTGAIPVELGQLSQPWKLENIRALAPDPSMPVVHIDREAGMKGDLLHRFTTPDARMRQQVASPQ